MYHLYVLTSLVIFFIFRLSYTSTESDSNSLRDDSATRRFCANEMDKQNNWLLIVGCGSGDFIDFIS